MASSLSFRSGFFEIKNVTENEIDCIWSHEFVSLVFRSWHYLYTSKGLAKTNVCILFYLPQKKSTRGRENNTEINTIFCFRNTYAKKCNSNSLVIYVALLRQPYNLFDLFKATYSIENLKL